LAVEDEVLDIAFETNLKHEVYISPRVIDRATLTDPVWRITPFLKRLQRRAFLCEYAAGVMERVVFKCVGEAKLWR
jgi:hypothetical protein